MPTFSGTAAAFNHYQVIADDKEQAIDFLFDMIKEDCENADAYDISDVIEVKN